MRDQERADFRHNTALANSEPIPARMNPNLKLDIFPHIFPQAFFERVKAIAEQIGRASCRERV